MEFKNKRVEYPNRYKILREDGTEETVKLIRDEGEVFEQGTQVNNELFDEFLKIDNLAITTGTSDKTAMTQKAATDAINNKLSLNNAVYIGTNEGSRWSWTGKKGLFIITGVTGNKICRAKYNNGETVEFRAAILHVYGGALYAYINTFDGFTGQLVQGSIITCDYLMQVTQLSAQSI